MILNWYFPIYITVRFASLMDQWSMLLHVTALKEGATRVTGRIKDRISLSPSPWFLLLYSNPVAVVSYCSLSFYSTRAPSNPQRPIRLGPRTECAISFQGNEEENGTKFLPLSSLLYITRDGISLSSSVVTM